MYTNPILIADLIPWCEAIEMRDLFVRRRGKKTNNPGIVLIKTFFFTTRRNRSHLRARLSPREITSRHCNFQSRSDVLQQGREDFFPKNLHLGHGNSKQWPLNFHVLASLRWMNAGKKKMKECGSNFPATTYKWDVSSSSWKPLEIHTRRVTLPI